MATFSGEVFFKLRYKINIQLSLGKRKPSRPEDISTGYGEVSILIQEVDYLR